MNIQAITPCRIYICSSELLLQEFEENKENQRIARIAAEQLFFSRIHVTWICSDLHRKNAISNFLKNVQKSYNGTPKRNCVLLENNPYSHEPHQTQTEFWQQRINIGLEIQSFNNIPRQYWFCQEVLFYFCPILGWFSERQEWKELNIESYIWEQEKYLECHLIKFFVYQPMLY